MPKTLTCLHCELTLANKSSLRRHVERRHSDHRAYVCTLCESAFKTADDLRQHTSALHTSVRKRQPLHACPECAGLFKSKQAFTNHEILRCKFGVCPVRRGGPATTAEKGKAKARTLLYSGFQHVLRYFPGVSSVKPDLSNITGAGYGVFATRRISRGEPITIYDGRPRLRVDPIGKDTHQHVTDVAQTSHFASLSSEPWIIEGLRSDMVSESNLIGRGIGSLCNHAPDACAKLVLVAPARGGMLEPVYYDGSEPSTCPGLVVFATRDINVGEEVTICYGRQTCTRLHVPYK